MWISAQIFFYLSVLGFDLLSGGFSLFWLAPSVQLIHMGGRSGEPGDWSPGLGLLDHTAVWRRKEGNLERQMDNIEHFAMQAFKK